MIKPWRSPAFRVQALAVLVAAFAMTAMLILRDTVDQRFNQRTAVALGADLILEGSRFPKPEQRQWLADAEGTRQAESVAFSSVLIHDERFLLASIRAVSAGFPLYGEIRISDSRFADPYPVSHGPKPGHVWIAGTGLDRLGMQTGEFITLGERSLLIDKVIVQEPDQQAGFYSMNPRALIHLDDLQDAGVLGEGSRYRHNLLVAADDATRQQLEDRLTPALRPDQELETVANTDLRSRGPVEQLFLWSQLAVMLVVLLCAAAIYLTSSHRARHQQTLCAVMKTVGASQGAIVRRLLGGDALALLVPALVGIALAAATGLYLIALMGGNMAFPVMAPLLGIIGPVLLWLGFAAPTLWAHLGLPATALLQQRENAPGRQRWTLLIALLTPPEEVIHYSRVSAHALAYAPKDAFKRKLIIMEERVGGEAADYYIRILQSSHKIRQAVVIKDPATGEMRTQEFEVEGPIAYIETTTCRHLNQENTSRCFEIYLDETEEQTLRIHERQRQARTLHRLKRADRQAILDRHHNAQRMLEEVKIVIPYVEHLTFPTKWLRTRRDNERFLCLIEASAFLHQYQRVKKSCRRPDGTEVPYVEANLDDYRLAYELAKDVLRDTLHELSISAREVLDAASSFKIGAFTRRDLREALGWSQKRVHQAVHELLEMEYLAVVSGGNGQTHQYTVVLTSGAPQPSPVSSLLHPDELARLLSDQLRGEEAS